LDQQGSDVVHHGGVAEGDLELVAIPYQSILFFAETELLAKVVDLLGVLIELPTDVIVLCHLCRDYYRALVRRQV